MSSCATRNPFYPVATRQGECMLWDSVDKSGQYGAKLRYNRSYLVFMCNGQDLCDYCYVG